MQKKNIAFTLFSILLIFCSIRFGILTSDGNDFDTSLGISDFILWLVSILSIGLGGILYTEDEKGYQVFALLNFIGVGLGYFISYRIGNFNLGTLLLLLSVLLFIYHSQLKSNILLNILCIPFIASFSIVIYGVLELVSFIKQNPSGFHRLLFSIITDFSIYVFLIVLPIAALYNLKFSKKLHNNGLQTLEHLFGTVRSAKGIATFLLIPISACAYYLHTYMYQNNIALLYGLAFLMAPLLIACIRGFTVEKTNQISPILFLLQIALIGSGCSLFIFRFS